MLGRDIPAPGASLAVLRQAADERMHSFAFRFLRNRWAFSSLVGNFLVMYGRARKKESQSLAAV